MKYLSDETLKNIKLKPCPFCGSKAEVTERYHTDEGYSVRVGCPKCFCRITKSFWFNFDKPTVQYNIDTMVEKWNTRT